MTYADGTKIEEVWTHNQAIFYLKYAPYFAYLYLSSWLSMTVLGAMIISTMK